MSQEGHFEEEDLADLFWGDCSFEEEVGVDDDDDHHKDNDCAAEVEVEVEVEEVVQETMLKHRRTATRVIIKKKNLNQMSEDELAAQLDYLIKNESMQDFCFARGKVGVCTCMHILREERFRSPVIKYLVDLKLKKSKAEIDSLVLEWYKYASQAGGVHSSKTSARVTPHKLWYKIPYDGSDAYALNVAIDPLKDALMCIQGLYLLLGFTHQKLEQCAWPDGN